MRLSRIIGLACFAALLVSAFAPAAEPAAGEGPAACGISLPPKEDNTDSYFYKQVELPAGKIVRAWTAISSGDFVLYVNGKEASRSRFGRVPSGFRMAEEVENLASFFKAGANTLIVRCASFTPGAAPMLRLEADVQVETDKGVTNVPLFTDGTWVGAYAAPEGWQKEDFKPADWQAVKADPAVGRMGPRIPKDQKAVIMPDVAPPLPKVVLDAFPQIAEMSDWGQQVVWRDPAVETARLMKIFQSKLPAETYARAIAVPSTGLGDSFSINLYPIGNGWAWTALGGYPFYNLGVVAGPEYQYPAQWNSGSTFLGDGLAITAGGKPLDLRDQWMWKIRKTDVVVTCAADVKGEAVFYTLTFAPPNLKALTRIFAVVNTSDKPLADVKVSVNIPRTKAVGKTLTESVVHGEMKAGAENTRTMIAGVLDDSAVTVTATAADEKKKIGANGVIEISFGDIAPGELKKNMTYRVMFLETWDKKPVPSDADKTLGEVKSKNYALLDETIKHWRDYNATSTTLEAPGAWGKRVADFIDDEKMFVQTQQFARTGAVGPMSFFSDEWIRDACGPIKSFLRTGKAENARRAIDYFYIASVANRIVLNWVGMDVDITKAWPAVEDWNDISVNAGGGDHVSAEVPSWLILQHAWYVKYTGELAPVREHWDYLKRLYYGQFDNKKDNIFRPDFKIPFHGDETYIYSGGEAMLDRYSLNQTSYPGGNIYSADSSFELVAAGDALVELGKAIGKDKDVAEIAAVNQKIREATEKYYWMDDLGFYAQGMSVAQDGQLNRYPMANIDANVIWSGYDKPTDKKAISNALRMAEYLMEDTGVFNSILGYDVTVGMLQGQCLHTLAAIDHPYAEKAFYALMMIAGDTTEFTEWMAPGPDYRTVYRANRLRPWEGGINLDASLYFLTGMEPDALNKKMSLTPRLPGGVYSPIKWDKMTVNNIPLGLGAYNLNVQDDGKGKRTYTLASASKDDVTVTMNCLIPFAKIQQVEVDGQAAKAETSELYSQALATVTAPLAAGKTLTVVATYQPTEVKPVTVDLKEFSPPAPKYDAGDVVLFNAAYVKPGQKSLKGELAAKYKVLSLDASIPTEPAAFQAALLTESGLKAKMLILGEGAMSIRKQTFWWDPKFDQVIGEFLKRGGVVVEANSGIPTSRWLQKTLAPATFRLTSVPPKTTAKILAMDVGDARFDKQFIWSEEKPILPETGPKGATFWEGELNMPYVEGGVAVKDKAAAWGEQGPSGCVVVAMKTTPGKDHLIRLRTWANPKKGFTLEVPDEALSELAGEAGGGWKVIQTVWVPQPKDPKADGWVDVYLVLPKQYVTGNETTFRLGAPKGSSSGKGNSNLASTGASRIWIQEGADKPPQMSERGVKSELAAKLGLINTGVVGQTVTPIAQKGFAAPYRIMGDSQKAAVIAKPVGAGLYLKAEMTPALPLDQVLKLVDTLMDETARKAAIAGVKTE